MVGKLEEPPDMSLSGLFGSWIDNLLELLYTAAEGYILSVSKKGAVQISCILQNVPS